MPLTHSRAEQNIHDVLVSGFGRLHIGDHHGDVNFYAQPERPETPPAPFSNVPFPRDPDYIDRILIMKSLEEKLSKPAAQVALVGLGGVGKSQLAIEHAHRVRARSPGTFVIWLHASSTARFEASIRDTLEQLKVPGRKDEKANVYQLLQGWLRETKGSRRWLVMIDNVDDAQLLVGYPGISDQAQEQSAIEATVKARRIDYFPACEHGALLMTSRSREAVRLVLRPDDLVDVAPMDMEQACALLRKRLGDSTLYNEAELCKLGEQLDYMPLALTQAASYIRQKAPRCSAHDYIQRLENSDRSQLKLLSHNNRDSRRDRDSLSSIILTWEITLGHIRQAYPSAADLLSLMSYFDPQAIPEDLLRNRKPTPRMRAKELQHQIDEEEGQIEVTEKILSEADTLLAALDLESENYDNDVLRIGSLLDSVKSTALESNDHLHGNSKVACSDEHVSDIDSEGFEDDLQVLRDYSLVTVTANSSVLEMHRLVQLATQRWLERIGRHEHWAECFVRNLDDALPFSERFDFALFALCRKMHPHAVMASKLKFSTPEPIDQQTSLSRKLEYYHLRTGNLSTAEMFASKDFDEINFALICRLGGSYCCRAFDTAAEGLFDKEIDSTQYPNARLHLAFLKILSRIYKTIMPSEVASRLQLTIGETTSRVDSAYHLYIQKRAKISARLYDWLVSQDDSGQPLVRELEITKKKGLENRTSPARTLYLFLLTHAHLRGYQKIEEAQVQAVEKSMTEFGNNHVFELIVMMNMAQIQMEAGRLDLAISVIRECATELSEQLGPSHEMALHTVSLFRTCLSMHNWSKESE